MVDPLELGNMPLLHVLFSELSFIVRLTVMGSTHIKVFPALPRLKIKKGRSPRGQVSMEMIKIPPFSSSFLWIRILLGISQTMEQIFLF